MCQNATFYEQCPPLHFPFAKSNYFPDEEEEERTDFDQSNFALSNVRALRAIIHVLGKSIFFDDLSEGHLLVFARSALTFESAKLD